LQNGYAATKWASEVFLEKANQQFGLPVTIHRPSGIMGEEVADDFMSNLLEYGSILKDKRDWMRSSPFSEILNQYPRIELAIED